MRDQRFIASHLGGPLTREQHVHLSRWASECSEHILPLLREHIDERLKHALSIAREWENGNASVGDARKASLESIAVARESLNPIAVAVARSVGHAVATAHMADHSLGAMWYALKAVGQAGQSIETERKWQDEHLPQDIRGLVLTARGNRKFKLNFK